MKTRFSICIKKVSYRSESEALLGGQAFGPMLRPYRCERCQLFHLTSRTKGKRVPRPPASPRASLGRATSASANERSSR